jgi:L-lactate dehydrogenase complex protein LldG
MAGDARAVVLERIQRANGGVSSAEKAAREWSGIRRGYRRSATRSRDEVIELLIDRLRDYDAEVVEVGPSGVAEAVAKMMAARRASGRVLGRLVVPAGLRKDAMVPGYEYVVDEVMPAEEMNKLDGVVTESTLAIAETGTIVLQTRPGQGRRAITLVPDYHLCIVEVANVVESVPEAMSKLQATAELATTFISGPSATADIEMTRIKGVHGPRFLDVVLVK